MLVLPAWRALPRCIAVWVSDCRSCTTDRVPVLELCSCRVVQGVYAPSEIDSEAVISYENSINNLTGTILKNYKCAHRNRPSAALMLPALFFVLPYCGFRPA